MCVRGEAELYEHVPFFPPALKFVLVIIITVDAGKPWVLGYSWKTLGGYCWKTLGVPQIYLSNLSLLKLCRLTAVMVKAYIPIYSFMLTLGIQSRTK